MFNFPFKLRTGKLRDKNAKRTRLTTEKDYAFVLERMHQLV